MSINPAMIDVTRLPAYLSAYLAILSTIINNKNRDRAEKRRVTLEAIIIFGSAVLPGLIGPHLTFAQLPQVRLQFHTSLLFVII